MVEITSDIIAPEKVIEKIKHVDCGCVVSYLGLIRNYSKGKKVLSVIYQDTGNAEANLRELINQTKQKYNVTDIAISHRTGELKVGAVNLVIAVAASHRKEGFEACQYFIDQFKLRLPTQKTEIYEDGSVLVEKRSGAL